MNTVNMKRVCITGSNRGIGLEFVRQYLEAGWRVYATCRKPLEAYDLHRLTRLHSHLSIHRLDITLQEDIYNIILEFKGIPLDLLINNAGINFRFTVDETENIHYDNWRRTFEVNTLGPLRVTEALKKNMARGVDPLVVFLSEKSDCDEANMNTEEIGYLSSKAALNTAVRIMAASLERAGVHTLLLDPGRVSTRMCRNGVMVPQASVDGMRRQIDRFSAEQNGCLIGYDGRVVSG